MSSGERLPASDPLTGMRRYTEGEIIAEKYRLGRKLGQGGMGEVWLAHNQTLDIDVAIKVIRADAATPDMADRLLTEARAAARLGHPAIVRINDFGKTAAGDPFIAMELLEGEDLANVLAQRGRLSAIKAVRTLLPIAHALTTAHAKGIVHRDLKPGNIFLARTEDGQTHPKLVDFGIAKYDKGLADRVTQNGAVLGSPLYMSPEQARGDDVDHRADIWALAVVLYETIAGRPPFDGKNYNAVLYSITANPATPITEYSVGDPELWSILERALAKDPDRRWYSMRDLGEALARWLSDRGILDDITGASLQNNWFSRARDEDPPFSSMPPPRVDLVPTPALAATTAPRRAQPSVTREPGKGPWIAVGVAAGLVTVGALALWAQRDRPAFVSAPVAPNRGATETQPVQEPLLQVPVPSRAPDPVKAPPVQIPTAPASSTAAEAVSARLHHGTRAVAPSPAQPASSARPLDVSAPRPLKDPFQ